MSEKVATKLKKLREEKHIPVEELSSRTGITAEEIALIESGKITPGMATLTKITKALEVRLGTVLDGIEEDRPIVITKNEDSEYISFLNEDKSKHPHMMFSPLTKDKYDCHMEPVMIRIGPKQESLQKFSSREGEVFIYILEGSIKLEYGNETYVLSQGDSIYFDLVVPNCLYSTTDKEAKVLAVTYSPA